MDKYAVQWVKGIAEGKMERAGLAAFEARRTPPSGGYTYEQEEGAAEAHAAIEARGGLGDLLHR